MWEIQINIHGMNSREKYHWFLFNLGVKVNKELF